ncbi:MAG TPA: hypothetical protein VGK73_32445 [Polyangiaceae bacterium]
MVVMFVGQPAVPVVITKNPGERWEYNLADAAPMPLTSIHNATVRVSCSPGWCPVWATMYADALRRGSVASHPEIQWGCPQ